MIQQSSSVDFATVRENNLSLVTNLIRTTGSISRADLVRQTKLSATTISSLVSQLLNSGYIFESIKGASSGGRPPVMLEFDYTHRYVVGVDMGSTYLHTLVMNLKGDVATRRHCSLDVINAPTDTIQRMTEFIDSMLAELKLSISSILGIGIGVSSPIEDQNKGHLSPVIYPKWSQIDIIEQLHRLYPVPIYLENDATACAMAIKWWGLGHDYANFAYIRIDTGVGGGLVINHQVYRGAGGAAGEIGHTIVDIDGPLCRCGNRGCLESLVSVPAILQQAAVQSHTTPADATDVQSSTSTIECLIEKALSGDPASVTIIENTGIYLGIAIANLLNLFNPELVVLGGEIASVGRLLSEPIQRTIKRYAIAKVAQEARLELLPKDIDNVAIGAATLVIQTAFASDQLLCTLQS